MHKLSFTRDKSFLKFPISAIIKNIAYKDELNFYSTRHSYNKKGMTIQSNRCNNKRNILYNYKSGKKKSQIFSIPAKSNPRSTNCMKITHLQREIRTSTFQASASKMSKQHGEEKCTKSTCWKIATKIQHKHTWRADVALRISTSTLRACLWFD